MHTDTRRCHWPCQTWPPWPWIRVAAPGINHLLHRLPPTAIVTLPHDRAAFKCWSTVCPNGRLICLQIISLRVITLLDLPQTAPFRGANPFWGWCRGVVHGRRIILAPPKSGLDHQSPRITNEKQQPSNSVCGKTLWVPDQPAWSSRYSLYYDCPTNSEALLGVEGMERFGFW